MRWSERSGGRLHCILSRDASFDLGTQRAVGFAQFARPLRHHRGQLGPSPPCCDQRPLAPASITVVITTSDAGASQSASTNAAIPAAARTAAA